LRMSSREISESGLRLSSAGACIITFKK
jgi:hypothetical protein